MTYSLRKVGAPHIGDSGPMSKLIWLDRDKQVQYKEDSRPEVGCAIRVGSHMARSYSSQDWWQTSQITEILSEEKDKVIFKTLNSEYEWDKF